MKREELISTYAAMYGISKKRATEEIEHFTEFVTDALVNGETIRLKNLGVFSVRHVEEKVHKLPGRETPTVVPSHYVPVFRVSDNLKKIIKKYGTGLY